jgi:hypothetical protein
MVQFIKQEAEEKANEIRVAAEEVREPPRHPGSHVSDFVLFFSFLTSVP